MVVGIVIGSGIFRLPSFVAGNVDSSSLFLLLWVAGGAISFVGALVYAELASSFPSAGGDYHFLMRAYGRPVAFLFAWARMTVMQTGSIALVAFVSVIRRPARRAGSVQLIDLRSCGHRGAHHAEHAGHVAGQVDPELLTVLIAVGLLAVVAVSLGRPPASESAAAVKPGGSRRER